MKHDEVISVAIVKNEQQQFLIARRQAGQHLAGKWEFPGGKVEEGETLEIAMVRELKEEVGLTAIDYTLFDSLTFQYDQLALTLHFYLVNHFSGTAKGLEGQELKWVSLAELDNYEFPKANRSVINKLS
jgi:8-oxo-dGTP diphosphatase